MQLFEYVNWAGLVCWISSGCCLAFFQIRKIFKQGVIKSLSAEISVSEKKVLIVAGTLFGVGILFFIFGAFL